MSEKKQTISLKDDSVFIRKKKLNLALNILISILGVSSLFIKFFLVDGVIAFRAFTVDGNIFTTIVSIFAVVDNIKELVSRKENESARIFYYQLASAVTESVIFIVVMIGYLPFFADDPKITPYHMFCLHVAIPVLSVVRFIFFERPRGFLKPVNLLRGAIPIGVYAVGVITAIKLGILPQSLIPYSFLDFKSNFLWYFMFALIVIPSFGYLWSWLFYRLNLKASILWYSKDDLEKINSERIKANSRFDVIRSSIMLIYCVLAIVVLMFSMLGTSRTSEKIILEDEAYIGYYMVDSMLLREGKGSFNVRDGALYFGDSFIGDGTRDVDVLELRKGDETIDVAIYVNASLLSLESEGAISKHDFVCVSHTEDTIGSGCECGDVLDRNLVTEALYGENFIDGVYCEKVKINKKQYYHSLITFGETVKDDGIGIISLYYPYSVFTNQAKNAELNHDVTMIVVVVGIFILLYAVTFRWINTLEKAYMFLKAIASGRTPAEPIRLHKRVQGLERELNILRAINDDKASLEK